MKSIFVVSNMFPSRKHPFYGIFVKNFIDGFRSEKLLRVKNTALIKGKKSNSLKKLIAYSYLSVKIILKGALFNHDIIYVHYLKYTTFSTFFIKLIKPKVKLVYNVHGSDILDNDSSSIKINAFKQRVLNSCDAIVVPSNYFAEIFRTNFPQFNSKLFISPSGGIDEKLFFKDKHNITKNQFIIGYIGRIDKGKGIETLLKATELIESKNIDFRVDIVGSGALEDRLKKELNDEIKTKIRFHGAKPQRDLRRFYNNFDIFVFPSERLNESLGLVGLESMACGTPVIGSSIGEIKNYIKDGYNGYLFNPKDYNMLAEKLLYFNGLNNTEKDQLSSNAIELSKKYGNQTVHNKLSNFLINLK
ncbi:glycosyltransferase family 4 protein [Sunxiuqinia rutila]|uniref:glycosyltransferase family 4 protein n=1 Tax=Sunxiuqinia rutila TaxID=1397841 RepID=UPI003D3637AD